MNCGRFLEGLKTETSEGNWVIKEDIDIAGSSAVFVV